MVFEYRELYLEELVEKACICMGLPHSVRWMVLRLLHRGLWDDTPRRYNGGFAKRPRLQNYAQLMHHAEKIEEWGIIEIIRAETRRKLIQVKLLLDVELLREPFDAKE